MIDFIGLVTKTSRFFFLPILLVLLNLSNVQAAVSPSFSASSLGATDNLSISIVVNVADGDVGLNGNVYVAFNLDDEWYFRNSVGWVPYAGNPSPVFSSGPLGNKNEEVVTSLDLSPFIGAQLYIGYGFSENEMVDSARYSLVYTVTSESVTIGPAPVLLGSAGNFAILAKTAISTVPASTITGNVAVSPAATSFLTGFSLTLVGTTSATSTQVVGSLFGADMTPPTNSNLTSAISDMEAAYTDAAGRPTPDQLNLGGGNIGGLTLPGGLYNWGSSVIIPANLALSGSANDVWIFQISGDLTISASQRINIEGGAQAKNVFWQVAGEVIIEAGAHFQGNILTQTAITMQTGASLFGRALAQTMVALDAATVTQPAP